MSQLAGQMERWSVDSLNVGVATGIMLHRLLTSGSASSGGHLSDQPPASASSLKAATVTHKSQDSAATPDADAAVAVPAADSSALGDGLAAIALADEVHPEHGSPTTSPSADDLQSSEPPKL